MQASSSGNYIAEEAFKNSFVQQSQNELKIKTTPEIEYYNGKYVFIKVDNSDSKSNYLILKGDSLINIIGDKDK
ncbi:MAG: hypothetical protein RR231_10675 [Acinetobacter sp.]